MNATRSMDAEKMRDLAGRCVALAREMLKRPARQMWLDCDKEADVLYVSFRRPQRATETVELNDDVLVRKDGKDIVGLTIMNASSRQGDRWAKKSDTRWLASPPDGSRGCPV